MSERDQSQQPEEPVTSIEDDAINDEQWKAMMDVTMAIYDFREPE
jgi:chromatin structure-remodeling complex subunit RSC1/2